MKYSVKIPATVNKSTSFVREACTYGSVREGKVQGVTRVTLPEDLRLRLERDGKICGVAL